MYSQREQERGYKEVAEVSSRQLAGVTLAVMALTGVLTLSIQYFFASAL